jgi:Saxitoxin biosynthesis operon protein SxtJ
MHWSDLPLNPPPRTLRQFAGLWIVFFSGVAAYQYFARQHETVAAIAALAAVTIGPLGVVAPAAIRPIFVAWLVLTFPIGWMISRLTLLVMFFGLITPIALFFRLRGRDALNLRPKPAADTYWVPKPGPTDASSYFRQY